MINKLPTAVSADVIVQEVSNEVLVYNLKTNKAICLNPSAAFIWQNCNGQTDFNQLIDSFTDKFNIKIDDNFIWLALDELNKAELIENENYSPFFNDRISRRKVLLNYALPIAIIPVITSVIAPTAVHAASGVCSSSPTATCSAPSDCDNNNTPNCADIGCSCGAFMCNSNCCSAGAAACA